MQIQIQISFHSDSFSSLWILSINLSRLVTSVKFTNVLCSRYIFLSSEKKKKKMGAEIFIDQSGFSNRGCAYISMRRVYWTVGAFSSPFVFPISAPRYYTPSRLNKFTTPVSIACGIAHFNVEFEYGTRQRKREDEKKERWDKILEGEHIVWNETE